MKERIITALILFVTLIAIVFFAPVLFVPLVAITLGVSLWEWCRISKIHRPVSYVFAAATIVLWIVACSYPLVFTALLIISALHYLYAVRLIYQYETISNFSISRHYLFFIGPFLLSALASTLVYIFHPSEEVPTSEEAMSLIFIVMLVAAADTGAYFTGRILGKHKLVPRVSPKKTIEGLFGGLLSTIVVAFVFNFMIEGWYLSTTQLTVIALATALFSVAGDLFISIVKRQNNIKDASQILPGHGGVLDRIDGLLAGIPIFYLLNQFL